MTKRTWPAISLVLLVLLVGTNAWWLYRALDSGVTASYREQALEECEQVSRQAVVLLSKLARGASRASVEAALPAAARRDAFEKDGRVWADRLGFAYGPDGRLRSVSANGCLPDAAEER